MMCFGCFCDEKKDASQEKNDLINRQMQIYDLRAKLNFKLLLLGAGECGKSTVLKQVKMVYNQQFSEEELRQYSMNLRLNALNSMQVLIEACRNVNPPIHFQESDLMEARDLISNFTFSDASCEMPNNIQNAISLLWSSNEIKQVWERRGEFWCLDSIDYYFDNIERFCEEDFVPEEQDCIMARVVTTGIVATEFESNNLRYQLIDVGGQRTERRKWIHCFDDVNGIIYLVNLNGYSTVLYEDQAMNRMQESLNLFEETVNLPIFENIPVYLLLNKKDLFEMNIRKKPLSSCFPDFEETESQDVMKAIEFVAQKFQEKVKDGRTVRVFPVSARFKKDIKYTWEQITGDIQHRYEKKIKEAIQGLENLNFQKNGTASFYSVSNDPSKSN